MDAVSRSFWGATRGATAGVTGVPQGIGDSQKPYKPRRFCVSHQFPPPPLRPTCEKSQVGFFHRFACFSGVSKALLPLARVPQGGPQYGSWGATRVCFSHRSGWLWHPVERLSVSAETRRAKLPERNAKGQCVVKVGPRSDYRVCKFSRSVSDKEVEQRRDRLKEVFEACGGWNDLSNFIAEHVRKGVVPVPLPDQELCGVLGVQYDGGVHWRSVLVSFAADNPVGQLGRVRHQPRRTRSHSSLSHGAAERGCGDHRWG